MGCVEVKEARIRGESLTEETAEHAATCPWCAGSNDSAGAGPLASADALFAAVEGAIARERGPVAWLRSRATFVRVLVATAVTVAVTLAMLLAMPRSRYAPFPVGHVLLVGSVFSVLLFAMVRMALRPLQAPAPTRNTTMLALCVALGAPVFFAVLPSSETFSAIPGVSSAVATVFCFTVGTIAGLFLLFSLRILDRNGHGASSSAMVAAAAGGLAGNLALEMHCPFTTAAHLLPGHAAIGFALVAGYALFRHSRGVVRKT